MRKVYMLDTNMISHIVAQHPNVLARLLKLGDDDICMSSIAYAEVFYGLAKKPKATTLRKKVMAVLDRIRVETIAEKEAEFYGQFRANIEASGKNLAEMDLLIASHAHYLEAVLVSADKAFQQIEGIMVEDWTMIEND